MQPLVLVSGGAGFIGSHLCERLLAADHEVLALDDLSSGRRRHVEHLLPDPRFRLLVHDVTQPLPKEAAAAERIFNLAGPAGPGQCRDAPVQATLTSVQGMSRVLELAAHTGARVLQASASEVYGDPQRHPQDEGYRGDVSPVGPRACYDEGKRCAETLCDAFRTERNVDVRIARLFNGYGPRLRADDGRVVSRFIVQALRGEPLTVHGDGRQTRSFCYVADLVDGLLRLMEARFDGPLNLGDPQERSVLELAQKVLSLTGSRSPVVRGPLPPDDPQRRCPDIALARRLLGWQPRVGFEQGLGLTIDYFRRELG